jgi:DNA-directed RNA polymerase subunit RPC12/RpoP
MPTVAEYVCQACGKVTRGTVPTRTDTMPACPCGGHRQIVRIRRMPAQRGDLPRGVSDERARE